MKPELDWIKEARKHIGLKEIKSSNKNQTIEKWTKDLKGLWMYGQPWCGTFIAHCLKTSGVSYPKHWYRALDYLNYGAKLKQPCYGCVAVKTRKGGGHVTFVVGQTPDGKLVCLGGNQNDSVNLTVYSKNDFEAFMWYGKTTTPSNTRYQLPIITNVKTGTVKEN